MHSVVGIFTDHAAAERAREQLAALGVPSDRINVLSPRDARELMTVPTTAGEQPGMGRAIGGVVGGVAGAAGGMQLATAAAAGFIPGVGPVIAVGLLAAALAGVGGAVVGGALENAMTEGLPKDELYVYEDALRRGRTVLIALTEDDGQADSTRELLRQAGAERLDAARDSWWVGLRNAEASEYSADGGDFARDEPVYRRGFEMAMRRDLRGKSYDDCVGACRQADPDVHATLAYRTGFERGRAYHHRVSSDS